MRRDKAGVIVPIGNGLCRVIVRSGKLAERLRQIAGVEVRDEDAEHLGWWVIFPERLRPIIEPAFRAQLGTIVTRHPEQLSLFGPPRKVPNRPPGSAEARDRATDDGPKE